MKLRSLLGFALLATSMAACGDDGQAGGGGTPGDTSSNGDTTSAESSTSASSSQASSSASTSAASTSGATTSSATSSSTGGTTLCEWAGVDPGNLVATGNAIGDVIENVGGLVDQCGVTRSLWDFAGGYRILSMTIGS